MIILKPLPSPNAVYMQCIIAGDWRSQSVEEVAKCQVGQSKFMNCVMAFVIKNASGDVAIETSLPCVRWRGSSPFDIGGISDIV